MSEIDSDSMILMKKFVATFKSKKYQHSTLMSEDENIFRAQRIKIGLFKCEICCKEFSKMSRLRKHRSLMHIKEKILECEFCWKKFKLKKQLVRHVKKSHSDDEMYRCSFCDAKFESIDLISDHKKITHPVEQPYNCDICGNKFKYRSIMEKHKLLHGKRKLFFCESCQTTHSSSTRPIREEPSLECGICAEKFESKSGLIDHVIETISDDKVYDCDICGTEVELNNVVYAHEVDKIKQDFVCSICRKKFKRRSNFTKHQQLHVKNIIRYNSGKSNIIRSLGKSVNGENHVSRQLSETQKEICYGDDGHEMEDKVEESLVEMDEEHQDVISPMETSREDVFVNNECEIKIEKSEQPNKVKSEVPDSISSVDATYENVYVKTEYEIEIDQHGLHEYQ